MCGIIGVKINKPSPEVAKNLIRIFKNQANRGTEGAGLSLLRDGNLTRIRKTCPYDLFSFEFGEFWNGVKKGDCILVHHRFPTNGGDGSSLKSNHPFTNEDNSCHLIHNGIVSNDDQLFKELRKDGHIFESKYEGDITDSEVLVHMVEKGAKKGCQKIVDKAKGSIAIAFQYRGDNNIFLWRRSNPIEVYSDKKDNHYFSSEFPENEGFVRIGKLDEHKLYSLTDKGLGMVKKYKKPKVVMDTWGGHLPSQEDYEHYVFDFEDDHIPNYKHYKKQKRRKY